jgi:hypothetical protein
VAHAADLDDLLRMGRLPEAWLAPPPVRELRELVRHRAKLVTVRSGLKAGMHAVLAKEGLYIPGRDLFGPRGRTELTNAPLDTALGRTPGAGGVPGRCPVRRSSGRPLGGDRGAGG